MEIIEKRSRQSEEFQQDKIFSSMRNAGASERTAQQVASSINYHDGITTSEVQNLVIGRLKIREPQAAKQYESHQGKCKSY